MSEIKHQITPIATKWQKLTQNNTKQYKAIELKYEGENYQAIAKAIRVPLDTIKGWFESDGVLAQYYENYTTNMNDLRKKTAEHGLVRNVATASTMLVALMGSEKDEIKFRAAKEILDRVIGEPQPPVEHSNKPDGSYERHLKEAREYIIAYLLFDIWSEKRKEAVVIRIELNPAYRFATHEISTQAS